ncbi:hypothetical protein ZIOFF_020018 [Zingiber officinale]|uniref:UDP-glycosyltransferase 83A1 n=1 Tax=Zingiber officinale TaxID=94328 RepID=A0A8J5HIQ1_ZINOF|nr:hypothetical protein ZIOFF_020018 [Zingiber officinale]
MGLPHVLALPFPAQGHVIPLMELCHCLVDHGFKVTFVNTNFNHKHVIVALSVESTVPQLTLVSIPDGLGEEDDQNDLVRQMEALQNTMPRCLEELIEKSNETGDPMTCMLVDKGMGWALEVGRKKGLRSTAFWPAVALMLAAIMSITDPGMPFIDAAHLIWNLIGDERSRETIFNYFLNNIRVLDVVDFIICNSFKELEEPTFSYAPKILPIGPLPSSLRPSQAMGYFWSEDAACLSWLDEHPPISVVYMAFGSLTVLGRCMGSKTVILKQSNPESEVESEDKFKKEVEEHRADPEFAEKERLALEYGHIAEEREGLDLGKAPGAREECSWRGELGSTPEEREAKESA